MKIRIIPYQEIDGIRTFTDSFIKDLYNRAIVDNLEYVFGDGSIDSPETFLAAMKSGNNQLFVIDVDGNKTVGFVWVNRFESRFARGHFCFFREFWGRVPVEAGKKFLKECVKPLDMIMGIVPYANWRAILFCTKIGMEVVGVLPKSCWNKRKKKSEDGVIVYYVPQGEQE